MVRFLRTLTFNMGIVFFLFKIMQFLFEVLQFLLRFLNKSDFLITYLRTFNEPIPPTTSKNSQNPSQNFQWPPRILLQIDRFIWNDVVIELPSQP